MTEPPWGSPSWADPSWRPAVTPEPPAAAAPAAGGRRGLTLALVGAAGAVAGAVATAFLVSAVFLAGAEDIGRAMARGLGEEIGTSIGQGMTRSMDGSGMPMDSGGSVPGPVEQFAPVPPVPGPDPVLDSHARDCFAGDLRSCDDLMVESPPLSDYERYALTCAGRVKPYTVAVCTDLGD